MNISFRQYSYLCHRVNSVVSPSELCNTSHFPHILALVRSVLSFEICNLRWTSCNLSEIYISYRQLHLEFEAGKATLFFEFLTQKDIGVLNRYQSKLFRYESANRTAHPRYLIKYKSIPFIFSLFFSYKTI
jgi:hypothetical protein